MSPRPFCRRSAVAAGLLRHMPAVHRWKDCWMPVGAHVLKSGAPGAAVDSDARW